MAHLAVMREALASRDKLVALQNELDVARKMQQSILPTVFPQLPNCELYGHMVAAREVGGDFFDVVKLADGRYGLAIADVSGKGVPAAMFMMSSRTLLKGAAIGTPHPGNVLREVNDVLEQDNESLMFVTLFYGVYDPATGELTYANGGHNPPLIVHSDGTSMELPQTNGVALGVMGGMEYEQSKITLAPGDTAVFYTDGVSEAMNGENEEFGMDRFSQVFANAPPSGAIAANKAVFEAVQQFADGTPQSDDITCLVLRRLE